MSISKHLSCLVGILGIAALDQAVKWIVIDRTVTGFRIFHWLNWILVYNPGSAFSLWSHASDWSHWGLSAFSVLLITILSVVLWRTPAHKVGRRVGLVAILGGALGNLIDRLCRGAVVDFIDFHIGTWHWPTFNIADAMITCGVLVLLWDQVSGGGCHSREGGK